MNSKSSNCRVAILALASALSCCAHADDGSANQAAQIKALESMLEKALKQNQVLQGELKQMNELKARVSDLEHKASAPSATANAQPLAPATTATGSPAAPATAGGTAVATEVTQRLEQVEHDVADLTASNASRSTDTGLPVHGFMDVDYYHYSKQEDQPWRTRNGFKLGTFDLYLTPQIGEHIKGLLEFVADWDQFGDMTVDTERFELGYGFDSGDTVWVGRFHTPFGYWNNAYHHGAEIQPTVLRPRFLAFEDSMGVMPSHSNGVEYTGKSSLDSGRLNYDLFISNGNRLVATAPGQVPGDQLDWGSSGSDGGKPGYGFNVYYSPRAIDGLTVGIDGLDSFVTENSSLGTDSQSVSLRFAGLWAYYETDRWEFLTELYQFDNHDNSPGGSNHSSWAGYTQASYLFAPQWTAIVRLERAALNSHDPYFNLQTMGSSYKQVVLGARYELDPRAAIKMEIDDCQDVNIDHDRGIYALRLQYAIRF